VDTKADKAFAELKRYLTSPPIMVAPWPREPLLLYIAATLRTPSAILVVERDAQVIAKEKIDTPYLGAPPEEVALMLIAPRDEPPQTSSTLEPLLQRDHPESPEEATSANITKVQKLVYFASTVLRDTREHYTAAKAALHSARRFKEAASLLPRSPYQGSH
jgi:hypothetical protein